MVFKWTRGTFAIWENVEDVLRRLYSWLDEDGVNQSTGGAQHSQNCNIDSLNTKTDLPATRSNTY